MTSRIKSRTWPRQMALAGGGGGYTTTAVHLDGTAYLRNAALVASGDSTGFCLLSYWFKLNDDGYTGDVVWVVDPEGAYPSNSYANGSPDAATYFIHNQFCNADDTRCLGTGADGVHGMPGGMWTHMLCAVQTNFGIGLKIMQVYINDVLFPQQVTDTFGAFLLTFNGKSFVFGDDTFSDGIIGDFADFYFAPGQYLDLSVEANRRKFISASGKPVSLGANGELPTGIPPAIFFSGIASTFGQPNLGTGGAFTLTGVLTNASSSPSD